METIFYLLITVTIAFMSFYTGYSKGINDRQTFHDMKLYYIEDYQRFWLGDIDKETVEIGEGEISFQAKYLSIGSKFTLPFLTRLRLDNRASSFELRDFKPGIHFNFTGFIVDASFSQSGSEKIISFKFKLK